MRNLKILLVLAIVSIFTSCEIVQETKFNPDGSGVYSLGINMSGKGMGGSVTPTLGGEAKSEIDTLIVFSDFLESKKDSIAKLSKEEQEKLKALKDFSVYMKSDSVNKDFKVKINYNFKDLKDLDTFSDKLENLETQNGDLAKMSSGAVGKENLDLNSLYDINFSQNKFSLKAKPEALAEFEKKDKKAENDSIPKEFADIIKIKMRYVFPYKIKSVSNKKAEIIEDSKGIEIKGNILDIGKDPRFFETEVEFFK